MEESKEANGEARAAGKASAECLATRAQHVLALFEAGRTAEALAAHRSLVTGYDEITRHPDGHSPRFVDEIGNTLYLISHFVRPQGAPRRRRASFEPESWEMGAELKKMEEEAGGGIGVLGASPAFERPLRPAGSPPLVAEEAPKASSTAARSDRSDASEASSTVSLSNVAADLLVLLQGTSVNVEKRRG